jgi:putative DNA primase/helicase
VFDLGEELLKLNKSDKPIKATNEFRRTDYGNAERLVRTHGETIRFCTSRGKWLHWNGIYWQWDETGHIEILAKKTVREILSEAFGTNGEEFKAIAKHAAASENLFRIRAMITLAQTEPGIPILPHQLDSNPWLLTVRNGTLDLKNFTLRKHQKEDLITRLIEVEYHEGAPCPIWLSFLDRVFAGNERLIGYLKRAVGYSLTSDTREQCIFFNYGRGANGKTTFIETIKQLLDGYAKSTRPETFMKKNSEGISNDLAELENVRLVVAVELDEGRRLAEVLAKQISGGDTIKARFLFHEFFEFRPQFKLWLCGNHKPQIYGTDHAIWRRIRLIPWVVTIPEDEQDKNLCEKLKAEWPGVLSWAVEGCLEWQREGLKAPEEVLTATSEYRKEQDILSDFFEQCVTIGESEMVAVKDFYEAYVKFCEANGETMKERLGKKKFNKRVADQGFDSFRTGPNVLTWLGMTLKKS